MWLLVAPAFEADYWTVLFDHVGTGGSDLGAYDRARYASLGDDDVCVLVFTRRAQSG